MQNQVRLTKRDIDAVIEKTVSRFRKIHTDISFDNIPTDEEKKDRILPSISVKSTTSYDFPYEEELKKILEEEFEKAKNIKRKQAEVIRHKIFKNIIKPDCKARISNDPIPNNRCIFTKQFNPNSFDVETYNKDMPIIENKYKKQISFCMTAKTLSQNEEQNKDKVFIQGEVALDRCYPTTNGRFYLKDLTKIKNFEYLDLEGVDFSTTTLDVWESRISFNYANLIKVNFSHQFLARVSFVCAWLENANFKGATFSDGSYEWKTNFRASDLTGANISHLTKQEFLDSTITDEYTILTDVKFKGE
jgi:hypothetical protein